MNISTIAIGPPNLEHSPHRTLLRRIGFRFVFVYLMLFILLEARMSILSYEIRLGMAPGGAVLQQAFKAVWVPTVSWVGLHVFHIAGFKHWGGVAAGTADGLTGYVEILFLLCLAAILALAWAITDRQIARDHKLHYWLRVAVRYVLAFWLLMFGMGKVIPNSQFFFPPLESLVKSLGDFSRYQLFWSSMGSSALYNGFAGATEVTAGLLLLFPRTVLLGALLSTAVMANVLALDFGYDISAKSLSIHLLVMAVFLLTPDLSRLAQFLLFNRPTLPRNIEQPHSARWFKIGRISLKTALILYMFISATQGSLAIRHRRVTRSSLYGIYDVQEFSQNGAIHPPLTTDTDRWRRLVFSTPGGVWIKKMDDSERYFAAEYDSAKGTLTILGNPKNSGKSILSCLRSDNEHLVLQGVFLNQSLLVKLARMDESKFPLVKSR
jgi:hypothetical protein